MHGLHGFRGIDLHVVCVVAIVLIAVVTFVAGSGGQFDGPRHVETDGAWRATPGEQIGTGRVYDSPYGPLYETADGPAWRPS